MGEKREYRRRRRPPEDMELQQRQVRRRQTQEPHRQPHRHRSVQEEQPYIDPHRVAQGRRMPTVLPHAFLQRMPTSALSLPPLLP